MKKLKSFLSVLWAVKKNDEKSNSFETERLLWRLFIVEKLYLSENWVEEIQDIICISNICFCRS